LTDRRLEVGRVVKAHGLRGEVVVSLISDYPDVRLAPGSILWAGEREVVVVSARPHQGRWLVQFEDVFDRTAAEAMASRTLYGQELEDPEAIWVHELIGSSVVEEGTGVERGRVVAVLANPAHELLELDSGALVPIVFVRSCSDGVTVVAVPEGLFDSPTGAA
jgi:16S rRNA processing protein RimM